MKPIKNGAIRRESLSSSHVSIFGVTGPCGRMLFSHQPDSTPVTALLSPGLGHHFHSGRQLVDQRHPIMGPDKRSSVVSFFPQGPNSQILSSFLPSVASVSGESPVDGKNDGKFWDSVKDRHTLFHTWDIDVTVTEGFLPSV